MQRFIVVLIMLFIVHSSFGQQTKEHRKTARAFHTVLVGDCDTDFARDSYQRALTEAAEADRIALIELSPGFVEQSILDAMIESTRQRTCELVLVMNIQGNVDAKLLSLMKSADGVVLSESIVFALKRPSTAEVDDTESVMNSRRQMIEAGLSEELAKILTFGTQHAWMDSKGVITLGVEHAPSSAIILADRSGVRIDTQSLRALRFNFNNDLKATWKSLGKNSVRKDEPETIVVGARDIAAEIDRRLADVSAALVRMEQVLDLPDPDKRETALTKYQIAADNALQIAEGVERTLGDTEERLRAAPQTLQIAPTDEPQIEVGKRNHAGAWKSRIKSRRTTLERLKTRAREFESAGR